VESFTLVYPDGEYDAETLLVDPITADVFVVTKENNSARVYRVNLNAAANGATLDLTLVQTVTFAKASGGDISADGRQIVLRREDAAMLWTRCDNEDIGTALGRAGQSVPVIGTPTEENGEAIAFLRDGSGYVRATISRSTSSARTAWNLQSSASRQLARWCELSSMRWRDATTPLKRGRGSSTAFGH
jgi:hypothetical protein